MCLEAKCECVSVLTTEDNLAALEAFFEGFPSYKDNDM